MAVLLCRKAVHGERTTAMYRKMHVHFVGIGGIGMSGIAELLCNLGHTVSGSDIKKTPVTDRLESLGVRIYEGHRKEQVGGSEVVIISSAIRKDNVEVQAAQERKIPVIPRAQMLAELMRMKYGIAVAGTHGKTTTTSMVATVLAHAGLDPTAVIGGRLKSIGSNAKLGAGDFLVAEADESDGTFLLLSPTIAVVTSIDPEHLDFYGEFSRAIDAYVEFLRKIPFYGLAVLCVDEERVVGLLPRVSKRVVTYGLTDKAVIRAEEIRFNELLTHFLALREEDPLGHVVLRVPGRHNVANALAAIAVGLELGIPFPVIRDSLQEFSGVERRFEVKGEARGIVVIDDYGIIPKKSRQPSGQRGTAGPRGPGDLLPSFNPIVIPGPGTSSRTSFMPLT